MTTKENKFKYRRTKVNVETNLVIKLKFFCTREDISGMYAHFEFIWIPKRN